MPSRIFPGLNRVGSAPKYTASDVPNQAALSHPQTEIQARTEIYTYFTAPGETRLLYSAPTWVHCRLTLENAGPVSVGTSQVLTPVLSGRGILLLTGVEVEFTLSKGGRLFIAAEAINRVKFIVEPFAWLEQLYAASAGAASSLLNIFNRGRK
jgi:hypothetical protein